MLTICPGRAQGQMWNQLSHTVSMFDKDEGMLKKMTSGCDFDTGNGLLVLMQPKSSLQTATITGIDAAFYCDMRRRRQILWNTVQLVPPPTASDSFMSSLFLLFFQQLYHSRGDCIIHLSGCLDCQKQIPAHILPPKALTNVCVCDQ